jgi:hypothetical protein
MTLCSNRLHRLEGSAKLQAGMLFGLHMSVPAFLLHLDIVLLSHWTLPTLLTSFLPTCSSIPDILAVLVKGFFIRQVNGKVQK